MVLDFEYLRNVARFPSHYGSRSTPCEPGFFVPKSCFHPTMVLAQLEMAISPFGGIKPFPSHYGSRSTQRDKDVPRKSLVSIPLWFSLNYRDLVGVVTMFLFPSHYGSRSTVSGNSKYFAENVFPSHYGSRSTTPQSLPYLSVARFHPTMVLAQHPSPIRDTQPISVSIPLWFSLNKESKALQELMYGFHPTMVLAQLCTLYTLNTITSSFHPTMVLAQPFIVGAPARPLIVSIPLWFSLNSLYYKKLYRITGGKVKSLLNPAQRPR